MQQTQMFTQGEDTPLFSQTAQRGKIEVFKPRPVAKQATFAKCRICLDTGKVDGHRCPNCEV